jgi:cytochrome bd ubiquinol oxidase subunit II
MSTLQIIWFFLIGVLLLGYTILDGYDLGAGFWSLFTKKDEHKRAIINAVGPFWDGNEVWILTGGGAIFAAFPHVYATVFSGFYLALMLLLLALIFRAVSVEFRYQHNDPRWAKLWDLGFGLGSALPAILFGVALGNVVNGLPLDSRMNFTGNFFTLLNPYALVFGLTGFAMFITHGALYLRLKTGGELYEMAGKWANSAWSSFIALYILLNVYTIIGKPYLLANYKSHPVLWIVPVLVLAAIFITGVLNKKGEKRKAFLMSCLSMAGLWLIVGLGLFPNLVNSPANPELALSIANSSSSALTLKVMLIIALIGVPIVLIYTYFVHKIFSGKTTDTYAGY